MKTRRPSRMQCHAMSLLLVIATTVTAGTLVSSRAWGATELVALGFESKEEYQRLLETVPEARDCGATVRGATIEIVVDRDRRQELEAAGWSASVLEPDLEAAYAEGITGGGLFGAYHTYTEAIDAMDALVAAHPTLIAPKFSIGQTIEGRSIWVYKISDNPGVDEDEPEVFFNSYIHSREAITFEILYDLAAHLLQNYALDPDVQRLVDEREIFLLPVVNPDGVEYNALTNPNGGGLWRKNRRPNGDGSFGVDLNRNFGFNWGYDGSGSSGSPSSPVYRGTAPFSEPETEAVRQFVNSRNFAVAINYHSYGDLEIFSPEYDYELGDDFDELLALARRRSTTKSYEPGTTWQILYRINGGANDWMWGETVEKPRIFAILTEVGPSFWPPESQIAPLVDENREGNLRMIDLADNPLRALDPAPSHIDPLGIVPPDFTLTWDEPTADPDNPAVTWDLIEATGGSLGADDMETDAALRWEADGFSLSTTRSASGVRSWRSSSFANDKNDVLISKRGYHVQPGDVLRFQTWYSIENNWDYGYVELTSDGRTYEAIPGNVTTSNNPNGRNTGNGITGSSGWQEATFDLSAWVGQVVWVRFRFQTDGATAGEGWYIDDVEPTYLFGSEVVVATGLTQAEYTFTDKPDGEFAYRVQGVDGEGDRAPMSVPETITVSTTTAIAGGDASGVSVWRGLELVGRHPFSGTAELGFTLPAEAAAGESVELRIHDVQGRLVAGPLRGRIGGAFDDAGSLRITAIDAGAIRVSWGEPDLGAGIYFASLTVGDLRSRRRLVRLP